MLWSSRVVETPAFVRCAEEYIDQEDYEEQEPYTAHEAYTEQEPYTEQEAYQENEPYTETVYQNIPVDVQHTKRRGGLAGALGGRKTYTVQETRSVPVQVQKLRSVTRHRDVTRYRAVQRTREVTRYRPVTRQRGVTRYRTATRMVDRNVEYFLPVEDFYNQALEQILGEVRAGFRAPIDSIRPEDSVSQVSVAASIPGIPGRAPSDDDSWSFISSARAGPQCFLPEALFQVSAGGLDDTYFLHAQHLAPGSCVMAADGQTVRVTRVVEHQVPEILELRTGAYTAPLRISPTHRVVTPGQGQTEA